VPDTAATTTTTTITTTTTAPTTTTTTVQPATTSQGRHDRLAERLRLGGRRRFEHDARTRSCRLPLPTSTIEVNELSQRVVSADTSAAQPRDERVLTFNERDLTDPVPFALELERVAGVASPDRDPGRLNHREAVFLRTAPCRSGTWARRAARHKYPPLIFEHLFDKAVRVCYDATYRLLLPC
jgi:hypothetical protein